MPHAVVGSYVAAFAAAHSLTYRIIEGADHGLTQERWKQAYGDALLSWLKEMMVSAAATAAVQIVR